MADEARHQAAASNAEPWTVHSALDVGGYLPGIGALADLETPSPTPQKVTEAGSISSALLR
jgi:hypothetical protein